MNTSKHADGGLPRAAPKYINFELHQRVISSLVLQNIRDHYEQNLVSVASHVGVMRADIERVIAAWGSRCTFVKQAMDEVVPTLREALEHRSEIAEDLCDPVDATLFVVSGGSPVGTHAHQDIAYKWNSPSDARYAYTTWIALDSCDATTAALRFSGAMPSAPVELRQDFLRADFVDRATSSRWREDEQVACAAPGDVVVFNACTWHASAHYQGQGRRMALAIRWTSKTGWERSIPLLQPTPAPTLFGMDTSGKLLGDAICAVCQESPPADAGGLSIRQQIQRLQGECVDAVGPLNIGATRALDDLALALELFEAHGARPSAHLWMDIRDAVLPALAKREHV